MRTHIDIFPRDKHDPAKCPVCHQLISTEYSPKDGKRRIIGHDKPHNPDQSLPPCDGSWKVV